MITLDDNEVKGILLTLEALEQLIKDEVEVACGVGAANTELNMINTCKSYLNKSK